jgi:hypothetical protein
MNRILGLNAYSDVGVFLFQFLTTESASHLTDVVCFLDWLNEEWPQLAVDVRFITYYP